MNGTRLNLGCGQVFIRGNGWINLDFAPAGRAVAKADLLAPLPIASSSCECVYSSHFLEHVPRSEVLGLLSECYRVLKPGGVLRLVLPDLEEMCREYLQRRVSGEHEMADFVVLEMVDQCVRMNIGGLLGATYHKYLSEPVTHAEMIGYVRRRNGERLETKEHESQPGNDRSSRSSSLSVRWRVILFLGRVRCRLQHVWFMWLIGRLPAAFRRQNVSLAAIGERHHWLWDFWQLSMVLTSAGFEQISKVSCRTSRIPEFPFHPLDADEDGLPRKGAESMYVEAFKPG